MQTVAEGTRFVTSDEAIACGELLLNPFEEISRFEPLGRFGAAAIFLHGDDVLGQMHVQGDFQKRLIYQLRGGNCRSSRSIVYGHTGRQSAMRVHPLSALMFSNTALEPTPTAP